MKIEELMNASTALNESDTKLLHFIIHNQKKVSNMNSQVMADFCHVSRATLLRVVQKIGLQTISDLQMLLQIKQKDEPKELEFANICNMYHEVADSIEKIPLDNISELLFKSEVIYIYGTGNEQKIIADEFKRIFTYVGKCVIEVFDYGEAEMIASSINKNDIFIIISLSGETREGVKVASLMNSNTIPILSITRLKNNTIARLCTYNLHVATNQIVARNSYELVAGFYMLIDNIIISYLNYEQEVKCGTR